MAKLKLRENFNPYLKLWTLIAPYWYLFLLAIVFMLLSAIFDGASLSMLVPVSDRILAGKPITFPYKLPTFLQQLIDKLNHIPPEKMLDLIAIFILVVFFLKAVAGFMYRYLISDIGQKIIRDLRERIYAKLNRLSLDFYSNYRSGELISRITNDVALIENSIAYGITELFYQGFQVLVFASIITVINYKLAFLLFIVTPLIVLPVMRIGRMLKKITHKTQAKVADISSLLYETISGVRIVKAFGMEDYELNRFKRHNRDYYHLTMKAISKRLLVSPLLEFLAAVMAVVILLWGGKQVLSGKLSFGVFALFLGGLLSMIRPLKRLSNIHMFYQQALAAIDRIYEILETEEKVKDTLSPVEFNFEDKISFKDVWFSYGRDWVLKQVSFDIPKGAIVAVVGPSGSGKSTIVNLLLRFYDPQKGVICIDGIDIRDFRLKDLRDHIGIVTQDTILFNDTIANNIAYGNINVSMEEIINAAKLANAHNFIMEFPNGYETNVGDLGNRLSGGQKQRIAIARAILKNPPILILDEATSHLDLKSEQEVREALTTVMKGRTVLIIAHRLSTIKGADCIVVVHNGRIVEKGKHEELISKDGLYHSLYRLQEL